MGCGSSSSANPVTQAEAVLCGAHGDQRCAQLQRIAAWDTGAEQEAGAVAFVRLGCVSCHTYRNLGPRFPNAPDLTHEGSVHDRAFVTALLRCPACLQPGSEMPAFAGHAPPDELDRVVAFVLASR